MKLRVTVNGVTYEVDVDILEDRDLGSYTPAPMPVAPAPTPVAPPRTPAPAAAAPQAAPAAGGKALTSAIPGTVVDVFVTPGQAVKVNDQLMVIDAMKMNTQVTSNQEGVIKEVLVKSGDAVKMNQVLLTFE